MIKQRKISEKEKSIIEFIGNAFGRKRPKNFYSYRSGSVEGELLRGQLEAAGEEKFVTRRMTYSLYVHYYLTAEAIIYLIKYYLISRIEWDDISESLLVIDILSMDGIGENIYNISHLKERLAILMFLEWLRDSGVFDMSSDEDADYKKLKKLIVLYSGNESDPL